MSSGLDALRLFSAERAYVDTLRHRDRAELVRVVERNRKRARLCVPLRIQVLQSGLPEATRASIFHELERDCGEKYTTWVQRAIRLPLGKVCAPSTHGSVSAALENARSILDARVTGHRAAKQEVLKIACQTFLDTSGGGYALGLEGPPGTGKTHFVKNALAPALNRPFVSIPLGGATDVGFLMGSLYVYEGSKEGRLAAGLIEAGCCNPVIHFDEVDKVSTTDRGAEIWNTLIHVIDPTANSALRDRYFHGIDIDFSRCTFVFSYNDASKINPVLLDRIRRVRMDAPSDAERRAIVRDHLVPRVQARLKGWTGTLSDEAVDVLLQREKDGGMRQTERDVDHVLSSARMCALCGSGALMDTSAAVVDATNAVDARFVRDVLTPQAKEDRPMTMYL